MWWRAEAQSSSLWSWCNGYLEIGESPMEIALTIWPFGRLWHPVGRGHDMRRALIMMGMLDVADMKEDKKDEYKLTQLWAVDEDGTQRNEEWNRDDERMIWNSQITELMKMIFRRIKNKKGMKDYLKLTEHWAPPLLPSTLQPTVTRVFISSSIFRTLCKTF